MKLNDLMVKPLKDIVEDCDVINIKNITDNYGNVLKIIVEYAPKDLKLYKESTEALFR